jgi:hypothetical protein
MQNASEHLPEVYDFYLRNFVLDVNVYARPRPGFNFTPDLNFDLTAVRHMHCRCLILLVDAFRAAKAGTHVPNDSGKYCL